MVALIKERLSLRTIYSYHLVKGKLVLVQDVMGYLILLLLRWCQIVVQLIIEWHGEQVILSC